MIKDINYEGINILLCKLLEDESGLAYERIVNALGITGAELSELISPTQQYSIAASDSFLLFELNENVENNFITRGEIDNEMFVIQSYDFHLMIYGNHSPTDAQNISAIFKQENVALYLRDNGIHVTGVSPISSINEFINNTLIMRRDLTIHLQCKNKFENVGIRSDYFEKDQEITLITKKI